MKVALCRSIEAIQLTRKIQMAMTRHDVDDLQKLLVEAERQELDELRKLKLQTQQRDAETQRRESDLRLQLENLKRQIGQTSRIARLDHKIKDRLLKVDSLEAALKVERHEICQCIQVAPL